MEEAQQTTLHIAVLASPGMGHLIPLAAFAQKFVHYDFTATFIIPNDGSTINAQKQILDGLPKSINYMFLPPINLDELLPASDSKPATRIFHTMARSVSHLRDAFKVLTTTTRLVAFVGDIFSTDAFDVAKEFNVPSYIFFTSTAMLLLWFLHLPKLDEMYSCEYRDIAEPVLLPGCLPLHGRDFAEPAEDRKDEVYTWLLHHCKRYHMADGILLNSFMDLEPGAIKALKEGVEGWTIPPVYPVGPIIQNGPKDGADDESECLRWLDNQPHGSVLFVSFGSGGTLTLEQLHELALGLELSQQRFLWVLRSPSRKSASAAYFSPQSMNDPLAFLPEGFLERTNGLGLVVPSWAPQIKVLSHSSTGGFLTHCGWNSALESVVDGVPLIAWPLYAEQQMNALLLVDDLKIALRPKPEENGIVGREEIGAVVKDLLEGEEGKKLHNKMRNLQQAAAEVLSEEGSSTRSLAEVAHKWKTRMTL